MIRAALIWIMLATTAFAMDEAELRALIAQPGHGQYQGPRIELPYGEIVLTKPLVIRDRVGFEMLGQPGSGSTIFRAVGLEGQPAIILDHCMQSKIGQFRILGDCETAISIKTRSPAPSYPISSENTVIGVEILGKDKMRCGVYVDSRERDHNNEFHLLRELDIKKCEVGIQLHGSQAHRIVMERCIISDARLGVWGSRGNYYTWRDGQMTSVATEFQGGPFPNNVSIDGHRSETCGLFLQGSFSHISVKNVMCDGMRLPSNDEFFVDVGGHGGFLFENCFFVANRATPLRFRFATKCLPIFNGVQCVYAGPERYDDDVPQKPVITNEQEPVYGAPIVYRYQRNDGRQWEYVHVATDPDPDPERGRIPLELEDNQINRRDTVDLGWPSPIPSRLTKLRSHSLHLDFSVSRFGVLATAADLRIELVGGSAGNRIVVYREGEGPILQAWLRDIEWRPVNSLVYVYDRDERLLTVGFNGQVYGGHSGEGGGDLSAGGSQYRQSLSDPPPRLTLGGGAEYTVRGVAWYDRALSQAEVRRMTK